MANIDIEEIKLKLYDKIKDSGWGFKLKSFILSDEFSRILTTLRDQSDEGKKFVPQIKYLFRAFEECPYDKLKVIMIGQDPYPYVNVPDGIAFSCSLKGTPEASLSFMFKEINDTVYKDPTRVHNADLARWSNQGMLMLNVALTTTFNKVGEHYELWKPFISFLLDMIVADKKSMVYVFLGKKAKEWEDMIPDDNVKIKCNHPAYAAHLKEKSWNSYDMFNKVNESLRELGKDEIVW